MFILYGWWLSLIAGALFYLWFLFTYGSLHDSLNRFLARHADWYLDTYIVTLMTFLIALSILFVALLRTMVMFRQYRFTVDKKAFHLRRGLFRIREIRVPYLQISTIDIEQPYHYRLLGLAQLDIKMNNDSGAAKTITNHKKKMELLFLLPIVDKRVAQQLSNHLMKHSTGELDEEDEEYEYAFDDEIPEDELDDWEPAK
jgi:uncharacterized membrane protein YdbT with pleckstrin-like domain